MNRIFSKFLTNKQARKDIRIGNQNEFSGVLLDSREIALTESDTSFEEDVTIEGSLSTTNSSVYNSNGGKLTLQTVTASKAFAGGATEVITLGIPANCILVAAQLRNDTILTATTGVSYSAAYSGGATQSIGSGIAFTKNTKTNTFFTVQGSGEATNITSNTTNITLTPNAGTLDTGTVTAVVYYYQLTTLDSVA